MTSVGNTLYVQTQGSYLHLEHDTLVVELGEERTRRQIPLHHLQAILVFGQVMVSPFLIHRCSEDGRSIVWLTRAGRFRGRLHGPTSGNVLLRVAQHDAASEPKHAADIARSIVAAKIQNARGVLLRGARDTPQGEAKEALQAGAQFHADALRSLKRAVNLDDVRGIEGDAGRSYFGTLDRMIRPDAKAFRFSGRSRRPPTDPTNALLSFAYALLANECAAACEAVGLDPQVGFLHALRPGRPSLALDLMEELRAPFADRLVLTLINRMQINDGHFTKRSGSSVEMTEEGRRVFLDAYQNKKRSDIQHGALEKKIPYGLVAHTQARLLARHLRNDLPEYRPFLSGS